MFLLIAASVLFLGLGALFVVQRGDPPAESTSAYAPEAPKFKSELKNGQVFESSTWKGAYLVHFWASWCPACKEELPEWLEFVKRYAQAPLGFLAISGDSGWGDAEQMISSAPTQRFLLLLDTDLKIADQFGTYQLPETYFVGRNHKIRKKWIGPQAWLGDEVRSEVDRLLQTD